LRAYSVSLTRTGDHRIRDTAEAVFARGTSIDGGLASNNKCDNMDMWVSQGIDAII